MGVQKNQVTVDEAVAREARILSSCSGSWGYSGRRRRRRSRNNVWVSVSVSVDNRRRRRRRRSFRSFRSRS